MTETTLLTICHEHFSVSGSLAVTTTDVSAPPLGLSESPTGGYRIVGTVSKTALTAASYFPPAPLERAPQELEDRIHDAIQKVRMAHTKTRTTKQYRR